MTGPLEVFAAANSWRARRGHHPLYDIRTASLDGHTVQTSSSRRLAPDEDLRETGPDPDVLIVPGGEGARAADPELVGWLRTHGRRAEQPAPST